VTLLTSSSISTGTLCTISTGTSSAAVDTDVGTDDGTEVETEIGTDDGTEVETEIGTDDGTEVETEIGTDDDLNFFDHHLESKTSDSPSPFGRVERHYHYEDETNYNDTVLTPIAVSSVVEFPLATSSGSAGISSTPITVPAPITTIRTLVQRRSVRIFNGSFPITATGYFPITATGSIPITATGSNSVDSLTGSQLPEDAVEWWYENEDENEDQNDNGLNCLIYDPDPKEEEYDDFDDDGNVIIPPHVALGGIKWGLQPKNLFTLSTTVPPSDLVSSAASAPSGSSLRPNNILLSTLSTTIPPSVLVSPAASAPSGSSLRPNNILLSTLSTTIPPSVLVSPAASAPSGSSLRPNNILPSTLSTTIPPSVHLSRNDAAHVLCSIQVSPRTTLTRIRPREVVDLTDEPDEPDEPLPISSSSFMDLTDD
jgi:hypothetical protein